MAGLSHYYIYIYMYTHINSTNINVDFFIVTWVDKIDITHDYWQQQQSPPSILAQNTIQSRLNSSRNIAEHCILCHPGQSNILILQE